MNMNYIVLFKGDDSDFIGNQSIKIHITTDIDLTGCKAHFRFMDYKKDFASIPASKDLELVFSDADTASFPLGAADGVLVIEDSLGKLRTASNRIHIVVTNSVKEAYENEDTQAITVTIRSGGNKPFTDQDEFDMECNDWDFRKIVARVWNALGGKVLNND